MLTPDDLTYAVDWDETGDKPVMVHIAPAELDRLWKAYHDERKWGFEQQREAAVLRGQLLDLRDAWKAIELFVQDQKRALVPKVEADDGFYWDGKYDALADVAVELRILSSRITDPAAQVSDADREGA